MIWVHCINFCFTYRHMHVQIHTHLSLLGFSEWLTFIVTFYVCLFPMKLYVKVFNNVSFVTLPWYITYHPLLIYSYPWPTASPVDNRRFSLLTFNGITINMNEFVYPRHCCIFYLLPPLFSFPTLFWVSWFLFLNLLLVCCFDGYFFFHDTVP